jgi:Cu+-exporting ATPase
MGDMQTQTLSVGGMSCAACSARVERVVGKMEGVTSVSVNLAAEKATVVFDPRIVDLSAIQDAITNAGYEVTEIPKKKP